jgi:hypothetical protein
MDVSYILYDRVRLNVETDNTIFLQNHVGMFFSQHLTHTHTHTALQKFQFVGWGKNLAGNIPFDLFKINL